MAEEVPIIKREEIDPGKDTPEGARVRREAEKLGKRDDALSRRVLKWWRGDAHTHSKESTREGFGCVDGIYDMEEALGYYDKLGLEFACFTDHSSKPASPEKQSADSEISQSLLGAAERITAINSSREGGAVALSGVEANIFFDSDGEPTLDLPPEVLNELDLVIASRHGIAHEKELDAIRESLLFAAKHPHIDVIGHPDRHIKVVGDWDILRAHCPGAEDFHREMKSKQQQKREASSPEERDRLEGELQEMYTKIRKAIGKEPTDPEDGDDGQLVGFVGARRALEERYWPIWEEITEEMAKNGKAFEINLSDPPQDKLVEIAAKAGVKFFINYDAHDFHQYRRELRGTAGRKAAEAWAVGEASAEDLETLKQYKLERLQSGPGVVAILRLARTIKRLESLGVTPERVVNASRENLTLFLTKDRGKATENIDQLSARS